MGGCGWTLEWRECISVGRIQTALVRYGRVFVIRKDVAGKILSRGGGGVGGVRQLHLK